MAGENNKIQMETDMATNDFKIAQLALRLEGTSISPRHIDCLDPYDWGQPVDKSSSAIELTTYAVKLLTDWEEYKEHGEDLFLLFKEEFANWSSDMFSKIKSPFKKKFRDYLHNNGVYTGKKMTAIGLAMVALLNAEELPEWPQETEQPDQRQQPLQPKSVQQHSIKQANEDQTLPTTAKAYKPQPANPLRLIRSESPYLWENDQPRPAPGTSYAQRPVSGVEVDYKPFDGYINLPPRDVPNERVDAYTQTSFIKLWNRSPKYTGQAYDILDDKVSFLLRICYNLGVQTQHFHGLFSRILEGKAQASYLSYVPNNDNPADAMTKASPNKTLKRSIDSNKLTVRVEGFAERPLPKRQEDG